MCAQIQLDDESLAEILHLLPAGLRSLIPTLNDTTSIITLLPPSTSTVFPLLLLELGAASPLVVLPSPRFLTAALSPSAKHPEPGLVVTHASILDEVVEQVWEDRETSTGILIVGDPGKQKADVARAAESKGLIVKFWEEIWGAAEVAPKLGLPGALRSCGLFISEKSLFSDPIYSDAHSYFYSTSQSEAIVTKVTHIVGRANSRDQSKTLMTEHHGRYCRAFVGLPGGQTPLGGNARCRRQLCTPRYTFRHDRCPRKHIQRSRIPLPWPRRSDLAV